MTWHRTVTIPRSCNLFIHYTLEAYDNAGLVSTIRKNGDEITLDFSTPLSSSVHYDTIVEAVIAEALEQENK